MKQAIYPLFYSNPMLPINIFGVGFEENQAHIIRKEGFHCHQLFLCTEGNGQVIVKNEVFNINRGDFFFLPAYQPHEYFAVSQPWKVQWIAFFANEDLLKTCKFTDFKLYQQQNFLNYDSYYKKIFSLLKNETESQKFLASAELYKFLAEIFLEEHQKTEKSQYENTTLEKSIKFIDEHYAEYITIEKIAADSGISSQYLCRLFQKYYHMRPFQYLAQKRIQKAKELLQNPLLPVSEIARLTGYDDFSYFCSVFRKIEGVSPTKFRGVL